MDVCGAASAIKTPSVPVEQALHCWIIFFSAERWSLLCRLGSAASGLISATRMMYCFCRNLTSHSSVSAKGGIRGARGTDSVIITTARSQLMVSQHPSLPLKMTVIRSPLAYVVSAAILMPETTSAVAEMRLSQQYLWRW